MIANFDENCVVFFVIDPRWFYSFLSQTTTVSSEDGYLADVNALTVGRTAVALGAGRMVADEPVDATAGVFFHKKVGDAVSKGYSLVTLYCNCSEKTLEQARRSIQDSIVYSTTPVLVPSVVTHQVSSNGIMEFTMPTALQT